MFWLDLLWYFVVLFYFLSGLVSAKYRLDLSSLDFQFHIRISPISLKFDSCSVQLSCKTSMIDVFSNRHFLLIPFDQSKKFPFDLNKVFLVEIAKNYEWSIVNIFCCVSNDLSCNFFNLLTTFVNHLSDSYLRNSVNFFLCFFVIFW